MLTLTHRLDADLRLAAIWDEYKKALASFWTASEIDLGSDGTDWEEKVCRQYFFFFCVCVWGGGFCGCACAEPQAMVFPLYLISNYPDVSDNVPSI